MSEHAAIVAYTAFFGRPRSIPAPAARFHDPDPPLVPIARPGTPWTLRRALPDDEPRIRALVRAERMNPGGLRWPAFIVACTGLLVVGAAQIRLHRDGSREFASLVVDPQFRGRGIGKALICTLLAQETCRLHVITGRDGVPAYERHGFRRVPVRAAPRIIRRHLRIGQFVGQCGRLRGRVPLGLCVLERPEQSFLGAVSFS